MKNTIYDGDYTEATKNDHFWFEAWKSCLDTWMARGWTSPLRRRIPKRSFHSLPCQKWGSRSPVSLSIGWNLCCDLLVMSRWSVWTPSSKISRRQRNKCDSWETVECVESSTSTAVETHRCRIYVDVLTEISLDSAVVPYCRACWGHLRRHDTYCDVGTKELQRYTVVGTKRRI